MNGGYIYVLQNTAYGPCVVKIGLTTREPEVRAREIYAGSTGVPMPFDVAVAYSVADCKLAEKRIHKRLAVYRLNLRREFFRLPPSVAASLTYETCAQVNTELGTPPPRPFVFTGTTPMGRMVDSAAGFDCDQLDDVAVHWVDPGKLIESPIGTSALTTEQLDRARILNAILARVHPIARKAWLEGFSRDHHPEREIRIWEHIAKAYLTIDGVEFASDGLKKEAFTLLLARSMHPTKSVLEDTQLRHFTRKTAKVVLDAYQLRPKPLVVGRSPSAS